MKIIINEIKNMNKTHSFLYIDVSFKCVFVLLFTTNINMTIAMAIGSSCGFVYIYIGIRY